MCGEHWHPHHGRRHGQFRQLEDLACLVDQLHLFDRVSALHKFVDMWNHVERYLMLEETRLELFASGPGGRLGTELLVTLDACARHRLKAGHRYATEPSDIVQRLQWHHRNDSCAVRTGDYPGLDRYRCELTRLLGTRREQREVDTFE